MHRYKSLLLTGLLVTAVTCEIPCSAHSNRYKSIFWGLGFIPVSAALIWLGSFIEGKRVDRANRLALSNVADLTRRLQKTSHAIKISNQRRFDEHAVSPLIEFLYKNNMYTCAWLQKAHNLHYACEKNKNQCDQYSINDRDALIVDLAQKYQSMRSHVERQLAQFKDLSDYVSRYSQEIDGAVQKRLCDDVVSNLKDRYQKEYALYVSYRAGKISQEDLMKRVLSVACKKNETVNSRYPLIAYVDTLSQMCKELRIFKNYKQYLGNTERAYVRMSTCMQTLFSVMNNSYEHLDQKNRRSDERFRERKIKALEEQNDLKREDIAVRKKNLELRRQDYDACVLERDRLRLHVQSLQKLLSERVDSIDNKKVLESKIVRLQARLEECNKKIVLYQKEREVTCATLQKLAHFVNCPPCNPAHEDFRKGLKDRLSKLLEKFKRNKK